MFSARTDSLFYFSGGVGLAGWYGIHQLRSHNSIVFDKSNPHQFQSHEYKKLMPDAYEKHMLPHHRVAKLN